MYALWILGIVILVGGGEASRPDTNSTDRRYLVEYSDYVDVPSFQKHDRHFDYYNIVPDGSDVAIVKCCPRGQYFDIVNYQCAVYTNSTEYDIFDKIQDEWNKTSYRFANGLPDCGNSSVLSVQVASTVGVDPVGVTVNKSVFSKYCIDEYPANPHDVVVLTCNNPETFCRTRPCFRKCCPLGQSLILRNHSCEKRHNPFKPNIYNPKTLTQINTTLTGFGIYLGDGCIEGKYLLENAKGEVNYLGINGVLYLPALEENYTQDEFCVEYVDFGNRIGLETFLCFPKPIKLFQNSPLQFLLISLGVIISSACLLVTFLVYLFSSKSQNLYGKTLMSYVVCLFSLYLCLAVVQLMSKQLSEKVCISLGGLLLFSVLAAFSWLNVMSFDIWKTFRLDRSVEKSKSEKNRIRFLWYSLYAWGIAAAITAACLYVNQSQAVLFESINPQIERSCFVYRRTNGIYVFYIGPISISIACNVIFYVQTAWKIWNVKADLHKMEKQKTKKFFANKDQFVINGKLFIVMGITWSLEIVSHFVSTPLWYITDAANALHGVFIFTIFVLKKKVLQKMSQKMRTPLERMRRMTGSTSEDLSTSRKDFNDPQTEGKTCATVTIPVSESRK